MDDATPAPDAEEPTNDAPAMRVTLTPPKEGSGPGVFVLVGLCALALGIYYAATAQPAPKPKPQAPPLDLVEIAKNPPQTPDLDSPPELPNAAPLEGLEQRTPQVEEVGRELEVKEGRLPLLVLRAGGQHVVGHACGLGHRHVDHHQQLEL